MSVPDNIKETSRQCACLFIIAATTAALLFGCMAAWWLFLAWADGVFDAAMAK